jgi:hypothetical protein
LYIAAQGLSIGQSVGFTPNTTQRDDDIKWMTKPLYYDGIRKELQYVGKPASGSSRDWIHYLYDESTDTWFDKGIVFNGAGHTWLSTMDPRTGDYYINNGQGSSQIRRYDRSSDRWTSGFNIGSLTDNFNIGAIAYHPNLFGTGRPGIFVWAGRDYICFNIDNGELTKIGPTSGAGSDDGTTANYKNGTGDYIPARDSLVCSAKGQSTGSTRKSVIEVFAGAGVSNDAELERTIVYRGEPPVLVWGSGADTRHGKLVSHPSDPARVLILEGYGAARVWDSTDGGANWVLKSYTHPFENELVPNHVGQWMLGRISEYGVIMGMSSSGTGGDAHLWKPND